MKPMAMYNWELAAQKRLRKERIVNILFGGSMCSLGIIFIASADSLVEIFLKSIGL